MMVAEATAMAMEFMTTEQWNDSLWRLIEPVYQEAFPSGAKTESILHSMLDRRIAWLHAGLEDGRVSAMAVTGIVVEGTNKVLIIDYMAVHSDLRGRGVGGKFLDKIREWAQRERGVQLIVIEVEAENTEENAYRMSFWEKCGFRPTAYVHNYIWVPEPYLAMALPLDDADSIPEDGKTLFRYITKFHEKAYRRR
jgi:GNAT superfamily N-acetyltransferase